MSWTQTKAATADAMDKGADKLEHGADHLRGDKPSSRAPIVKAGPPPPAYSDIAKAANDLLSKDFYHVAAANLEVKTKAPNGVAYTIKGKSAHDKPPTASLEGKATDKATGMTGTLAWSTANIIDAKVESENNLADGLKLEGVGSFKPDAQDVGAKLNLYFKQPNFHFRVLSDVLKGPSLNADLVLGSQGFLVGGEAGYDVQKAALTRYSASVGYAQGSTTSAITASNNFSIFAASVYNKVNSETEIGVKAAWDSKSSTAVGMELAAKYKLDPLSFVKGKVDDRGIAALAYNTKVNSNLTFGVGTSFDTQKLDEGTHKVGCHFAFDG